MPPLNEALPAIVRALGGRAAPPPEPGSRFEAAIGFAASGRGARIVAALDGAGLLEPEALADAALEEVVDSLRDARIEAEPKAVRLLQRIAAWYREHRDVLEAEIPAGAGPEAARRDELAAVNGVGRSTADAMALHVFGAATYPVDRASYRILVRHGWIDPTVDYEEASHLLVSAAESDPAILARISDGFADVGRRFCKPSGPRCEPCPLRGVLPDGGPVDVDG